MRLCGMATKLKARSSRPKRAVTNRVHSPHKWSAGVAKRSDALDLQRGVFKQHSARRIAQSLKKSAQASHRRKAGPFQSAMSMLNFEINRAGVSMSPARRRVLNQAKAELRKAFHKSASSSDVI